MRLTIITVSFNSADTIEDTLVSVAGQDYPDVEHIVIDGGSTDGTQDILAKYGKGIARWTSEPDSGIYDAMNKGISMATGSVIGMLNSDDIYAHDRVLEKISAVFTDSGIDACYADLVYVNPHDMDRVVRYVRGGEYREGMFQRGWCPPHPTFFVRKDIYNRLGGFDLQYAIGNDVELMMRFMARYRIRTTYIQDVMVKMRTGGESNRNIANIVRQNLEILRAARYNRVPVRPLPFLFSKVISRFRQFLDRPAAYRHDSIGRQHE